MSNQGDNERKWSDYPDELGRRFTDVVRDGAFHCLGDLSCWCRPSFEIVEGGDGGPFVLIKHNDPPHSFVSGQMKNEAIELNESTYEDIEDVNVEELLRDPDAMICEVCGAIEGHSKSPPTCVGPAMTSLQWIGEDGSEPYADEKG